MNIQDTFHENDFMKQAFGSKLSKVENISTTKEIVKPIPIDEILKNLHISTALLPLNNNGYISVNTDDITFVINKFDSDKRKQYTKAYFLGQYLNPDKNETYWLHFAAELLMPKNMIVLALRQAMLVSNDTNEIIANTSKSLNVAKAALKIRMEQLDLFE